MITIPELHYGDILVINQNLEDCEVFQVVQSMEGVYLIQLRTGVWVIKAHSLEGLAKSLPTKFTDTVKEVKHIPSNKAQITISELPEGNATVIVKEAPSK